jgi:hypothetical protein
VRIEMPSFHPPKELLCNFSFKAMKNHCTNESLGWYLVLTIRWLMRWRLKVMYLPWQASLVDLVLLGPFSSTTSHSLQSAFHIDKMNNNNNNNNNSKNQFIFLYFWITNISWSTIVYYDIVIWVPLKWFKL